MTEHLQGAIHAVGGGVVHRPGLAKPGLGVPLLLLGDEPRVEDVRHVDSAGAAQVNLPKPLGDLLVEGLPQERLVASLALQAQAATEAWTRS